MADLRIAVAVALAPATVREWTLRLPPGATVADALCACGMDAGDGGFACGIWGRVVRATERLRDGDRVEWCRPLRVDPKLARRQRFTAQGARAAGLFARRRPATATKAGD